MQSSPGDKGLSTCVGAKSVGEANERLTDFVVAPRLRRLVVDGICNPAPASNSWLLFDPHSAPTTRIDQLRKLYFSDPAFVTYLSISLRRGTLIPTTLLSLVEKHTALGTLQLHVRSDDVPVANALLARLRLTETCTPNSCFALILSTVAFDHDLLMETAECRLKPHASGAFRCVCVHSHCVGLAMMQKLAVPFWSAHSVRVAALRRQGSNFWLNSWSSRNNVLAEWWDGFWR
ncbi:hypothetical protein B0H19DRAFT_1267786 [Mycena capillaripes]|nr:hypothetical protein B0H19DRAFT_1267786 [Mycena capillaripes]